MAYTDDLLNAAQRRRTRTGNSYFPAVNTYRGININAAPSANAINSTPQSQQILSNNAGRYDLTSGRVLPPDQNPAYQKAINPGAYQGSRTTSGSASGAAYTWITTPSGGQMRVPTGSLGALLQPGTSLTGSKTAQDVQDITHVQNQLNFPRLYGQGYGNVPPVSAPLTAQERVQRGQSGVGEIASVAAHNILGVPSNQGLAGAYWNFGMNNLKGIASWFGGGNTPSVPPSANAGVLSPSPTPYQTPNPSPTASPTATPTPFKVADGRSDLLKDTDNIFYGGGNAPIPTPTPTPGPNLMAYNPPRRYSDLGYY